MTSSEQEEIQFLERLRAEWRDLDESTYQKISGFRNLVRAENEVQNLTKLIAPMEFLEGHVLDVKELLESGFVSYPAMDLGSGVGVPGLLSALISDEAWVLAESEGRKAAFLADAVKKLGLNGNVEVFSGRAEAYLGKTGGGVRIRSVVARAVGSVERIYGWIRRCSTWNNLVLLKGPAWNQEWEEFLRGKFGSELKLAQIKSYEVGSERKQRQIVRLERVPRGT